MYCHTNRQQDGKGMGLKSKKGFYGCSDCHDVYDRRRPLPEQLTLEALDNLVDTAVSRTDAILIAKGLPILDDHAKKGMRIAKRLQKGNDPKPVKKKLVSAWAVEMKAMIKAKRATVKAKR